MQRANPGHRPRRRSADDVDRIRWRTARVGRATESGDDRDGRATRPPGRLLVVRTRGAGHATLVPLRDHRNDEPGQHGHGAWRQPTRPGWHGAYGSRESGRPSTGNGDGPGPLRRLGGARRGSPSSTTDAEPDRAHPGRCRHASPDVSIRQRHDATRHQRPELRHGSDRPRDTAGEHRDLADRERVGVGPPGARARRPIPRPLSSRQPRCRDAVGAGQ